MKCIIFGTASIHFKSCQNMCISSTKTFVLARCTKVQRAIVVILMSALSSHFKVLCQSYFVMGKVLSGELSSKGTGHVIEPVA